jgi:hypothetical protein
MNAPTMLSPGEAATRLQEAGLPITPTSVRRWCQDDGFGVRLMGRWLIPDARVVDLEQKIQNAGDSNTQ